MMFEATARCDEANLPWLGIPFALWSLGLFMVLLLIGLRAFRYRPPSMFLR
jgi:disulfide bond formation protein DsbB